MSNIKSKKNHHGYSCPTALIEIQQTTTCRAYWGWMSCFLMALQHNIGYLMPYN